jgi:hypothetical protein
MGSLKEENPKLYALAKQRVLGLQYGMGAKAFAEACRKAGFSMEPEWSIRLREQFVAGPRRDAMFAMLHELERAGMKITVTDEDTIMELYGSLDEVMAIFARRLPPTLKVVESPPRSGVPTFSIELAD